MNIQLIFRGNIQTNVSPRCDLVLYKWSHLGHVLPNPWYRRYTKDPLFLKQKNFLTYVKWNEKGSFTCLEVHFFLKRSFGYYMTQIYMPSILTCLISFVSFWIDHRAVPARISVGLLTVLTVTTQSSGNRRVFYNHKQQHKIQHIEIKTNGGEVKKCFLKIKIWKQSKN